MTLFITHNPFDIGKIREFYDPNPLPGFFDTPFTIPAAVKDIADKLNGQKMSVQEAIEKFEAVRALVEICLGKPIYHANKLLDRYNGISMRIFGNDGYNIDCTVCLIKFR